LVGLTITDTRISIINNEETMSKKDVRRIFSTEELNGFFDAVESLKKYRRADLEDDQK